MARLMREEGLPYGNRAMTYNSRLAQEVAAWAATQSGEAAIHDTLFKAYFVEGRNLADREELIAIAAGAGLSAEEAKEVIVTRSFREVVDEDWQRSRDLGITGVPTYICSGKGVVGAQPYEALAQLVTTA